jgi:DNA-binding NtrC family response regulator
MPEMDGLKLLARLRELDPDVPVIMVTAMHDIAIALEAIRNGAYDYILKPFEKDQLYMSVGRALEHRRLVMENRSYQSDLEQLVAERTQQLSLALRDLNNRTITRSKLSVARSMQKTPKQKAIANA